MKRILMSAAMVLLAGQVAGAQTSPASGPAAPTRRVAVNAMLGQWDGPLSRTLRRPDLSADDRAAIQKVLDSHQALAKKVIGDKPDEPDPGMMTFMQLEDSQKDIQDLSQSRPWLYALYGQEYAVTAKVLVTLKKHPAVMAELFKKAGIPEAKRATLQKILDPLKATQAAATQGQPALGADVKFQIAHEQIVAALTDDEYLAFNWTILRDANNPSILILLSGVSRTISAPEDGTCLLGRASKESPGIAETIVLKKGDSVGFKEGKAIAGEKEIALTAGTVYLWMWTAAK